MTESIGEIIDKNPNQKTVKDEKNESGEGRQQYLIIACYKFKELINFYLNEDLPVYWGKTSFYGSRNLLKPLMLTLQRVFFENLSTLISFSDVLEMNKSILFDSFC